MSRVLFNSEHGDTLGCCCSHLGLLLQYVAVGVLSHVGPEGVPEHGRILLV